VKLELRRVLAPLRAPWQSAHGLIAERELVLLTLEDAEGRRGYGEAAPLPSYDGVELDHVEAALEDCRTALEDGDGQDHAGLLAKCARLAVLPQAVAAVDLALWDLAGRRANAPVWSLLGAQSAPAIEVNYTISASDRSGAAAQAAGAREEGYRCVKAKVGIGDDAGRVAAIRAAAGPEMAIRIDANGVWSVDEAPAALRALAPARIELCEEPVRGLADIARISELSEIPVALDESAGAPGALEHRVCTAVCLKIARCGGISGIVGAAATARAAGYEVYLASTLDGPLGVAAALHAAAVIGPDRPCGLATLGLFAQRADPLPAQGGRVAPPAGPGLGEGLTAWYGE
jgi:L-Ala-D/L-Glu epimerase